MKKTLFLLAVAAVVSTGCSRGIKTREINFYRYSEINEGQKIFVDIIYPRDLMEYDKIRAMEPSDWFKLTNTLRNEVWAESYEILPCRDGVRECRTVASLIKMRDLRDQQYLIVIANLGRAGSAIPPDSYRILAMKNDQERKPRKREYVQIFQGYMERLNKKPRGKYPVTDTVRGN